MHTEEGGVDRITEPVIGGGFQVLNTLGVGFLERAYENALVHELRKRGLAVVLQHGVTATYDGAVVGAYNVDPLVEGSAQCLDYLKATGLRFCPLLNFGRSLLEIQRIAHGF